jgi:hypothetical protein
LYIIDFGLSQSLTVDVNSVLGGYTMWMLAMLSVFQRYMVPSSSESKCAHSDPGSGSSMYLWNTDDIPHIHMV